MEAPHDDAQIVSSGRRRDSSRYGGLGLFAPRWALSSQPPQYRRSLIAGYCVPVGIGVITGLLLGAAVILAFQGRHFLVPVRVGR